MSFLRSIARPATETCDSCQAASSAGRDTPSQAAQVPKNFTYDDGGGRKDTVLMQGPLSEVLRQALQVKFESSGITSLNDAMDVDRTIENVEQIEASEGGQKPALETQAQDEHVNEMLKAIANTPGADVVLSHFDYKAVQEHVKKFENPENVEQQDIPGGVIPLYVTSMEDMESVKTIQRAHGEQFHMLVLDDPLNKTDDTMVVSGTGGTEAFRIVDTPEITEDKITMVSSLDRVAAIESAYARSGSRVFFGLESLVEHLAGRLLARQKKGA